MAPMSLNFRAGSIVVDYIVLLKLPFSTNLNEKFKEVKESLKETLVTVSNNSAASCQENECESPWPRLFLFPLWSRPPELTSRPVAQLTGGKMGSGPITRTGD